MGAEAMTRPEPPQPGPEAQPEASTTPPARVPGPEASPEASPEACTGSPPGSTAKATAEASLELPPVESIDAETDLAPWLRPGVPAAIRNAALRRKWLTMPAIRDYVDPALDYAWDWNAAQAVPGAGGRVLAEAADRMLRDLIEAPAPPALPAVEIPVDTAEAADPSADPSGAISDPAPDALPRPAAAPAPRRRHGAAAPRPTGTPGPERSADPA
jgi:hypothetical protein